MKAAASLKPRKAFKKDSPETSGAIQYSDGLADPPKSEGFIVRIV